MDDVFADDAENVEKHFNFKRLATKFQMNETLIMTWINVFNSEIGKKPPNDGINSSNYFRST